MICCLFWCIFCPISTISLEDYRKESLRSSISESGLHYLEPALQPRTLEVISLVLSKTSRSLTDNGPLGSPSIRMYQLSYSSLSLFIYKSAIIIQYKDKI